MSKAKKKRTNARAKDSDVPTKCRSTMVVDRIDLVDHFEEGCAQAIGITSLLMEADADIAIQNAAWVVRDLVERIRNIGRILLKTAIDDSDRNPSDEQVPTS